MFEPTLPKIFRPRVILGGDCERFAHFPAKNLIKISLEGEKSHSKIKVYRRKGAYRFKSAFPEPYPLQKRSLSAKNKLSDYRQWHQKVSKIISSINYMKKTAMQRYNREAIRQKSKCHMFVDDADFL